MLEMNRGVQFSPERLNFLSLQSIVEIKPFDGSMWYVSLFRSLVFVNASVKTRVNVHLNMTQTCIYSLIIHCYRLYLSLIEAFGKYCFQTFHLNQQLLNSGIGGKYMLGALLASTAWA